MRYLIILIASVAFACNMPKRAINKSYRALSLEQQVLADSLLLYGLNHEALYTLTDTLKPMSSIRLYRFPLFGNAQQKDSSILQLKQLQELCNRLSIGDWQFVFNPFERKDSIYRNVEIYVVRKSRLQNLIRTHELFYANFGITVNTPPATILAITEYEQKYNRWRSYGYLFGYPDYAVDFFVAAGKEQDSTRQFVKRNFFNIPVYAAEKGYFTYAIPQTYQPGNMDSSLYAAAQKTLNRYKRKAGTKEKPTNLKPHKIWAALQ